MVPARRSFLHNHGGVVNAATPFRESVFAAERRLDRRSNPVLRDPLTLRIQKGDHGRREGRRNHPHRYVIYSQAPERVPAEPDEMG